MDNFHHGNILFHVLTGTLALLVGLIILFRPKGTIRHIRYGRLFMWLVVVVIITALIGVFIFKRNNFLVLITLLSGYTCFSGIRAIRLAGRKPRGYDYLVPVVVMTSALYYLYYLSIIGLFWAPTVTYSTIGALFVVTLFDLSKILMPTRVLGKAYPYEHVYKMVSTVIALSSAFSGTVFPGYKPYSQLAPSVIGFAYIIVTFIELSKNQQKSLNKSPSL